MAAPSMRVGDNERDAVAAELREHYARGRLSLEEFNKRIDEVFKARTRDQLDRVTGDLPHVRTPSTPLPIPTSDDSGYSRASDRSRRPRFAVLSALIAALASWLIVVDFMAGLRFLPGKIGIFLAIFAIIRGLFRRIFRR